MNTIIKEQARNKMMSGITVATEAVRLTYGPGGKNAVVENEFYPFHTIVNDAQTIIQAIQVEDLVERQGLSFLKELSDKAHKDSGDGRKTTCIIAEEILDQSVNSKLELDSFIPIIEKKIDEKKKIINQEEVFEVAKTASGSERTARLLSDVYKCIGRDGIIHVEGSETYETSYKVIDGIRFLSTGYLSPYLVSEKDKAVYENPLILVSKKKIEKDAEVEPLINLAVKNARALVIFTDDMDANIASRLIATHRAKAANILIIKAPVLWKQYVFEDFAKVTGSTIVEDASGVNFKNLELSHLGTCGKITVDKDETIIIDGLDISEHLASLKAEGSEDSKLRLSWLTTKTAIIKLGANSESELSYIRLKCEDAINSTRLALRDGIVSGGGKCLDSIANEIDNEVIKKALKAPLKQNLENLGITTPNWGDEVVDASAVIKNAVRNAISLATTILTTGIVITIPPKTPEQIAQLAMQQKGLRM